MKSPSLASKRSRTRWIPYLGTDEHFNSPRDNSSCWAGLLLSRSRSDFSYLSALRMALGALWLYAPSDKLNLEFINEGINEVLNYMISGVPAGRVASAFRPQPFSPGTPSSSDPWSCRTRLSLRPLCYRARFS